MLLSSSAGGLGFSSDVRAIVDESGGRQGRVSSKSNSINT